MAYRNEILPPMSVLEQYAKRIGAAFITWSDKQKVIAHYKNFGSLLN